MLLDTSKLGNEKVRKAADFTMELVAQVRRLEQKVSDLQYVNDIIINSLSEIRDKLGLPDISVVESENLLGEQASERIVIDASGYDGIGTKPVQEKLESFSPEDVGFPNMGSPDKKLEIVNPEDDEKEEDINA